MWRRTLPFLRDPIRDESKLTCSQPFDPSKPFVEREGYAWCVNCHANRFSTKCKKCRRPVTDTVLKALGAEWHPDCFCCAVCLLVPACLLIFLLIWLARNAEEASTTAVTSCVETANSRCASAAKKQD